MEFLSRTISIAIFAITRIHKTGESLIFTTYAEVRTYYEKTYESSRRWTMDAYRSLSLSEAIRQATDTMELTQDSPKKDRHKRYSRMTLSACRDALLAKRRRLKSAAQMGFDALRTVVGEILDEAGLQRVRDLGRYDFTIKIGTTFGLEPEEKVYVHRKPLRIARTMGLPIERDEGPAPFVKRSAFPPALRSMRADSLENMLCNCGDELVGVTHRIDPHR